MIISSLQIKRSAGLVSAEATVRWEKAARKPFRFFVQTPEEHASALQADANAFLIGSFISAWALGEQRINVEGTLCPLLLNHLEGAMMMLRSWYPQAFGPFPVVEAEKGFAARMPKENGAISLMSGGIDSLCLLRSNHLYYHTDHPSYINAVVPVAMVEHKASNTDAFDALFQARMTSVKVVADDQKVKIIPVASNVYWLNPDEYHYGQKTYASQLSSILAMFSGGFHHGFIASSYDAAYASKPWGSNPQLDAYFSSGHFRIENAGSEQTRLKKVGIVADWPAGASSIRVCQNDNAGGSNCGTCEKCIRTQLMLEALGKLRGCTAFPHDRLELDLLEYLKTYEMLSSDDAMHNEEKVYQYGLVLPYLHQRGRHDLAQRLKEILDELVEDKKNRVRFGQTG